MASYIRNSDNYHGRSKTSSGQQNSKKKGSGRHQKNLSNNNIVKDHDASRRPKYTMDDFWGTILPESSVPENAWAKGAPGKNEIPQNNGHKTVDQAFFWGDDKTYSVKTHSPVENVWEKRKEQLETRKTMEPASQTEEERMIQKAIELSRIEALEKKKLEEEYELQQSILKKNPTFFTEFQTTDELNLIVATNDYLDIESFCDDFTSNCEEINFDKEAAYKCQKELDDYWSQKKNNKPDKSKKNKDQFLKFEEHSEDGSSQKWKNKKFVCKSEKGESEHCKEDLDTRSDKVDSVSNSNNEANQGTLSKISKVIDMFGGWGTNSSYIGNSKSSQEQDNNFESGTFSNYDEVVSKNEETTLKKILMGENDRYSLKDKSKTRNSAKKENDDVVSNKKTFSDNVDEKRQDSVPELDATFFPKAIKNSSNSDAHEIFDSLDNKKFSYKKNKKSPANDDDVMNSIVQDYTDLSLKSSDVLTKETVPIYEQAEKASKSVPPSKDSIFIQKHNNMHENVLENFQKPQKNLLSPTNSFLMNEKMSSDLNQSDTNQDSLTNEKTKNGISSSLSNVLQSPANFSETYQNVSQKEKIQATFPSNTIASDQEKKELFMNEIGSFNNFSSETLQNSAVTNANISDPLPSNSNQNKDNFPLSFLNDSVVTTNAESNFIDPPIPAPVQPETCQHDTMTGNLMDSNFMMNMNPQIMHQMMLLSNSFILQQLHQMNMYYKKMGGIPFVTGSPLPPSINAQYPPILNNPLGNIPSSEPALNAHFVHRQDARGCLPVSPPHEMFDPRSQNCASEIISGDSSNIVKPTPVKFDESWLSDIMSEGAAYVNMDSYIPPPKMPEKSTAIHHLSSIEENKVDLQVSQSYSDSVYKNGSISQAFNCCDIQNPESQNKAVDYSQPQKIDRSVGWDILDKKEADISDELLATGWGNIENGSQNKYSSWDDDIDGWGGTTIQPMWNSTRYKPEKNTNTRQPSRQPLAKTYQRRGKF